MEVDGLFLARLADAAREGAAELRPEVVLVGSNRLGLDLGRRLRERTGGWANVRFFTLLDLAKRLAPESGARTGPGPLLSRAGRLALAREALRRTLESTPGLAFQAIAASAGFPAALSGLFDDFLDAGLEELPPGGPPGRQPTGGPKAPASRNAAAARAASRNAAICVEPRRWEAIRAVYDEWRALLADRGVHPAQRIARGAAHAGEFRARLGVERLWMAGFYELTPNQLSLVRSVAAAGIRLIASVPFPEGPAGRFAGKLRSALRELRAEVLGPELGSPRIDAPAGGNAPADRRLDLGRLEAALFAPEGPDESPAPRSGKPDGSLAVVSAPDEEREVREAARAVLRLFDSENVPFDRIAVTFPAGRRALYRLLVEEIFTAAGIPHEPLRELAQDAGGRGLRALLDLLSAPAPPRTRFLDLVGFLDDELPISPGRLERLSRRGGIAAWEGSWAARLLAAARPSSRDEGAEPRLPDPAVAEAIPRLQEILDLLAGFPARGSWDALQDRLDAILASLFPRLGCHPEVRRIASELRALSALEPETTVDAFRAAWEDELHLARPDDARVTGVVVGDLTELRGLTFEAVFLLGAAERSFPAPPRSDPLLPDSDRAGLNAIPEVGGRLAIKGERLAEEELVFAQVVASARRLLQVSFPRLDSSTGRSRLPSVFFLRAADTLAGRRIPALEIGEAAEVRRIGLTHGAGEPEEALTLPELALAAAVAQAAGRAPRAESQRAVETLMPAALRIAHREDLRWSPRLSEVDGLVPPELLARLPGARITAAGGSISPSRLETYAHCPHRYLHRYVLNLQEAEEPEAVFSLPPLERGLLVHRILEGTYRELSKRGLLPLTPARLAHALACLDAAAAEEWRRADREVTVGLPAIWQMEKEGLEESLRRLLTKEAAEDGAWIPSDFELKFGRGPGEPRVMLETVLEEGGPPIQISLQGKIDRLDVSADGHAFRVIDYKTGELPVIPFNRGQSLQLPIYLLAGAELLRARGVEVDIERCLAAYRGLDGKQKLFPGQGWPNRRALLELAARTIASSIEGGLFHQIPDANRDRCEFCDFKEVCDSRVEAIARRKEDPRTAAFDDMAEALQNEKGGRRHEPAE